MKKAFHLPILFLLVAFLLPACASNANTPLPQATPAATLTFTAHPSITPLSSNTPQPSPSRTSTPLPTHTHTSTPSPTLAPVGNWLFPIIEIRQAPVMEPYAWHDYALPYGKWVDDQSVAVADEENNILILDAYSGKVLSVVTPTPYATIDYQQWLKQQLNTPSRTDNFEIVCSETGLEMVGLPNRELVSRSNLPVSDCSSVSWASDGSAASLVTDHSNEVFVWHTDGTDPYWVGDGWTGIWSPDNDKLLVLNSSPTGYADEATFNIAYPDGKPMRITGAVIEAGNQWEIPYSLNWITNDIVRNRRGCVIPNYCNQDYYHAESGNFLIRNGIYEIGGQEAVLSPDQCWLAMEVDSYAENWEELYTDHSDTSTWWILYDLKRLTSHKWATGKHDWSSSSLGLSVEFIGWSADSRQFYFVYYPFSYRSTDLPAGYSRLDRNTLKTRLLVPNVIFTKFSPDGQYIFMVTADRIEEQMAYGVKAAIYTLEGKPVSELQFIADQLPFEVLNPTNFYNEGSYDPYPDLIPSRWNNTTTEIAYADPSGNLWLKGTNGESIQIASGLPVEPYWQEKVRFSWSPDDRLLLFRWDIRGWIIQIHIP